MQRVFLVFIVCAVFLFAGCTNSSTVEVDGCGSCHGDVTVHFEATEHGHAGLSCIDCHQNLDVHLQNTRHLPNVDVRGETCAVCHTQEHGEWKSSPHAQIPLELFPNDPRVMECMKCHQGSGFAAVIESGENFKTAWGPPPVGEPEAVTCVACHSPHGAREAKMLRLPKGELCTTCHGGKWQDLVLTGDGRHLYVDKDYSEMKKHPHNSGDRCVTCHMGRTPGVNLGGHTFSMGVEDGGLPNIGACVACHSDVDSYDVSGKQGEVEEALMELRVALEEQNNGALPGNEPGACNQCHRGGTLPFDDDPDKVLGNAYENYKLVERDKSLGVHNAMFALEILRDALESVK